MEGIIREEESQKGYRKGREDKEREGGGREGEKKLGKEVEERERKKGKLGDEDGDVNS